MRAFVCVFVSVLVCVCVCVCVSVLVCVCVCVCFDVTIKSFARGSPPVLTLLAANGGIRADQRRRCDLPHVRSR
jgi:hypothetical protein